MGKHRLLGFLFFLLLLWCESSSSQAPLATPCSPNLSILINETEAMLLENGSIAYRGHVYPPHTVWRDEETGETRGCICQVASKPCLRKCCGPGEFVVREEELTLNNKCTAVSDTEPIRLQNPKHVSLEIRHELNTRPFLTDWFTLVEGSIKCDGPANATWLDEDFPEDEYELRVDGSLWWMAEGTLSNGKFCVDRQVGKSELAVLGCLNEPVVIEKYPLSIMWIGYFLSLPFLLITFLVYAIIPELRNIYGKTLMCYVLSLFVAYASICVARFYKLQVVCKASDVRSIDKRSVQCDKFELYSSCSPSCERICDDINNDDRNGEHCNIRENDCVEKCVCKKGYVREKLNGKCIRIQECPRVKH